MKLNLQATIQQLIAEERTENERQAELGRKARELLTELMHGVRSDVFNGKFEFVDGDGQFSLRGYNPRETIVEVSAMADGSVEVAIHKRETAMQTTDHQDAMRAIARALRDAGVVKFLEAEQ